MRDLCRDYGVAEPEIDMSENWVTVTFLRNIEGNTSKVAEHFIHETLLRPDSQPESLKIRALTLLSNGPLAKSALSNGLGHKAVSGQLNKVVRQFLADKVIEYTIPEKPNSRLQKYRLTAKGKAILEAREYRY